MLRLFFDGFLRYLRMMVVAINGCFDRQRRLAGALLSILLLPVIILLQAIHWLLWLVDEVFFRDYKSVLIKTPVFIIGPPRTGTTFLHHAIAKDDRFCTFRLWECLFGVTISGRKLCLTLARLDRLLGAPATRLSAWIARKAFTDLEDVHPISLNAPEEDFFVFMPLALCFLLIVPFPKADWLFRFSRFDVSYSENEKQKYMQWYRRCIQKHLYVNGVEKQFLSKNASLAGMSGAILTEFPDARILATWREPVQAVPSQLSSLLPSLRWFVIDRIPLDLQDQLVDQMVFYYEHLAAIQEKNPNRVARIDNAAIRADLAGTVRKAFDQVDLALPAQLEASLEAQSAVSRSHRSSHIYAAEDFGLSDDLIRSRFANSASE